LKHNKKELLLGTANFNSLYRISQQNEFEPLNLLETAYEKGIRTLDISNSYIDAYKFVAETNLHWKINAKIVMSGDQNDLQQHLKIKVTEIREQMPNTKISTLMIHNLSDVTMYTMEEIISSLRQIAQEFDIEKIGVSLYPEQINELVTEHFDVIQIPINVLDQRVLRTSIMNMSIANKFQLQARSIYLRGLLSTSANFSVMPNSVDTSSVDLFKKWCVDHNLSPSFVCLNFVYHLDNVSQIIFGANDVTELLENIDFFNKSESTTLEIPYSDFQNTNLKLIDPRYWDA
jgi:aryl-alcohol dehydrogenase-like predicted oxidoreductase